MYTIVQVLISFGNKIKSAVGIFTVIFTIRLSVSFFLKKMNKKNREKKSCLYRGKKLTNNSSTS